MRRRLKDVSSIHLHQIDGGIETTGLAATQSVELVVRVAPDLIDEARGLLERTVSYVLESGRRIASGETMAVGCWLVRFTEVRPGALDLWEFDPTTEDFVPGVERALTLWRDQNRVCDAAGADFMPPLYDRTVVLSDGVLEGDPVEGVRYPSPEHMSGWWVTTDRYDGDPRSLRGEHLFHVCVIRSDLAGYLALPPGYRFDTSSRRVWFDQAVASDED